MNDHTVPQLPPRSQCTGCAACAEGCPKNAIHMLPDREGFLYPTVTDACIQCGHCTHICPVLRQREAHPEPAVFAAWNPDHAVRQDWRTMCWRAAAWCSVPGWTPSCGSAMKR